MSTSTFKCLIVDDEAPARKIIERFVKRFEELELTDTAKNAIEAMNILKEKKIDIIFLDINMPEISGIALLKMLTEPPIVILTTAYSEYALESYEYNVADYLLKPIRFERFAKAIDKAKALKGNQQLVSLDNFNQDIFNIELHGEKVSIPTSEISYFQSLGNYIKLYSTTKSYVFLKTTKELEDELNPNTFVRVHKSFIVNINKINKTALDFIVVNETKIPIGKTFKKYFKSKIKDQ